MILLYRSLCYIPRQAGEGSKERTPRTRAAPNVYHIIERERERERERLGSRVDTIVYCVAYSVAYDM